MTNCLTDRRSMTLNISSLNKLREFPRSESTQLRIPRPKFWSDGLPDAPIEPAELTVDLVERKTGILDQYGRPIMRGPEKIGYV